MRFSLTVKGWILSLDAEPKKKKKKKKKWQETHWMCI